MTPLPLQRPSSDRRTVVARNRTALLDTFLLAGATGWTVWSAERSGNAVVVVLARG